MSDIRFCTSCGASSADTSFPSSQAVHCDPCSEASAAHRKEYQKIYNSARSAALKRLVVKHRKQFFALLEEEKVERGIGTEEKASA